MKAALILSGSGVYDGSEIHETVLCMLALEQEGFEVQSFAPDMEQLHVINHMTGEEMNETRHVLIESARIARGNVKDIRELNVGDYDALVMPGGFGAAKNLSTWAVDGPGAGILPAVKNAIVSFLREKKPVLALCISPVVVALALKDEGVEPAMTVGNNTEKTPYDIKEINEGLESIGARMEMKKVSEFLYDETHKIITTPCYMQDVSIVAIHKGITGAVKKLKTLVS